jgi:drug/metabolite transporter (DMT)-like permease
VNLLAALQARWAAMPANLRGILWVLLSGLLFTGLNVATVYPAKHTEPLIMPFLRYAFGLAVLMAIIPMYRRTYPWPTAKPVQHFMRAGFHSAGMFLWFFALPLITLADITALGFTGPIFITIGAALFLKEDVRLRRWIAVFVGFAGAMIIIRPGFHELSYGALAALLSTPLFAVSNLWAKSLAKHDSADTIVLWQNIYIPIWALPVAIYFWHTPSLTDGLWLLLAGLLGTLGHLAMQRGYQIAEITALQPIGFLTLIWNAVVGFFLFSQRPDVWTFVGAVVIFSSAMYISHREAVRKAKARSPGQNAP